MRLLLAFLALASLASACTTPEFEFESTEAAATATCHDGLLGAGETDVDCGGSCATACATSKACLNDVDCASKFCAAGICQDQTCSDHLKNQDESDIDCGGETGCARCEPGKACASATDCNGGTCMDGICRVASCGDTMKNQSESDVDCGGLCGPCATGKSCNSVNDCDLALCTGGKCREQTCADGIDNQDETDVDCGGSTGCPRCATSQRCIANSDCNNARCSMGTCQPTSCADGVKNGNETDLDCGGSCDRCADTRGCLAATDCVSQVCTAASHECAAPTCTDGVLNGSEPTLDCGASCSTKCKVADTCKVAGDCATGKCTNLHCVPSSPTNAVLSTKGWLATASDTESSDSAPHYALDGDVNTHWTNGAQQAPGMWFLVDMGKPQVFFSVDVISTSVSSDYAKTLKISGSNDGQTFTVLRTGIAGENTLKIVFADPEYARFLKLELLDSTMNLWWRIDELSVLQ